MKPSDTKAPRAGSYRAEAIESSVITTPSVPQRKRLPKAPAAVPDEAATPEKAETWPLPRTHRKAIAVSASLSTHSSPAPRTQQKVEAISHPPLAGDRQRMRGVEGVAERERTPSKQQRMLALLKRAEGASIAELQGETGWQAHSVRGFLSATVRKKLQLPLINEMRPTGERVYRVAGGADA